MRIYRAETLFLGIDECPSAKLHILTSSVFVRLLCMFWLGLMQCVGWVTYSASPRIAAEYYGFENPKASIDMLLNWGPIMPLG